MSDELDGMPVAPPPPEKPDNTDLTGMPVADTTLQDNYTSASKVDPDHAAKVMAISGKTGANPAFVSKNIDQLKDADKESPTPEFFQGIQKDYPKTAALLASPFNMAKTHDDLPNVAIHEEAIGRLSFLQNLFQQAKAGSTGSILGMFARGEMPDAQPGTDPGAAGVAERAAFSAGKMVPDLPFYLAGGAMGAVEGGGVASIPLAGAAAFALPAFIRTALIRNIKTEKGETDPGVIARIKEIGESVTKEGIVGAAQSTAGAVAAPLGIAAKLGAEGVAMVGTGAALEGKAPKAQDWLDAGVLLLGMHAAGHAFELATGAGRSQEAVDGLQADSAANSVYSMDALAKASKWRERDPEGYAAHVNDLAAGGPGKSAMIPVDAFEKAFPNTVMAAESLGLSDAYKEAKATGSHVEVPMGTFLSKGFDDVRANLAPDTKFDADAKTQNQIKAEGEEKAAAKEAQAAADKKDADQGMISKFVSTLREKLGIPEEQKAAADAPEPEKPAAPAKIETPALDENPAIASRQQSSRTELDLARSITGQDQQVVTPDAKLADHQKVLQDRAHAEAESILMKPQLKEITEDFKTMKEAEQDRLTKIYTQMASENRLYRAARMLRDQAALTGENEDKFGPVRAETLAKNYIDGKLGEKSTAYLETIAELHGYSSGDELAKQMLWNLPEDKQIEASVKAGMEKFRDLRDTTKMQELALEAVHNEKSAELLALKSEIAKSIASREEQDENYSTEIKKRARQAAQDAKDQARATIAAKAVEDAGDFRKYYTAERDAAVRAAKATSPEDVAQATQEQLAAHAMASEALRARDKIERWSTSLEKNQKADKTAFKTDDNYNQAASILSRFGFAPKDWDASSKTQSLADWVDGMNEKGMSTVIPDWLQNEGFSSNWKKLTMDQLHDVRDAVANVKHLANNENTAYTIQRGEQIDALTTALSEQKAASGKGGKTPGPGTAVTPWDKVIRAGDVLRQALVSPETLFASLDRYDTKGAWTKTFVTSLAHAEDSRSDMMQEATKRLRSMHSEYSPEELKELDSKRIFIPEFGDSLTKNNLITLAANQGTEQNAEKAREQLGVTLDEQGRKNGRKPVDQDAVDRVLDRVLDKRDRDLVQKKLDYLKELQPKIGALYRKLAGFEPEWVESRSILTKHGEYDGGYYPLIPDPRLSTRGFEDMKMDQALNDPPPTWKAATRNGFTQARSQFAKYPVSLDADGYVRHVSDVIHDLNMREWVIDAQRIMGNRGVQADLTDAFGKPQAYSLTDWVKQIAGNDVKPLRGAVDGAMSDIRRRTTVAQLAGKLNVMISQIHGITAAGGYDPKNFGALDSAKSVLGAWGKTLISPSSFADSVDFAHENSSYMRQESRGTDRDLMDASRDMAGKNSSLLKAANWGFGLVQKATTIPLWNGAYARGLELNDGDHKAAVDYADAIIRNSGSPGRRSALPEIMRSGELGALFTQFHGFIDRQAQLMYRASDRVESPTDIPQLIGTTMAVMVMPNLIYAATHGADKKSMEKALIRSISPLTLVPGVTSLQDMLIDHELGGRVNATMTPAGGLVDAYQALLSKADSKRARTQDKIEAAAHLASYAVPYPDQLNTWAFNTADYINRGMKPHFDDAFRRRPAKERSR